MSTAKSDAPIGCRSIDSPMPSLVENSSRMIWRRTRAGSWLSTYAEESVMEAPNPVIVW